MLTALFFTFEPFVLGLIWPQKVSKTGGQYQMPVSDFPCVEGRSLAN